MASADAKLTCSLHLTKPLTFLDETPAHYLRRKFDCDLWPIRRRVEVPLHDVPVRSAPGVLQRAAVATELGVHGALIDAHARVPPHELQEEVRRCGNSLAGCEWSYRCAACSFDLQASCANLREKIMTRYHPVPLKLLKKSPYLPRRSQCGVYDERVPTNGWVYHRTSCKFDLHPSSALLPLNPLCSAHPHHLTINEYVSIDPSKDHLCDVCLGFGGRFGFRCDKCDFDIHPKHVVSSLPGFSSAYAPQVHTLT